MATIHHHNSDKHQSEGIAQFKQCFKEAGESLKRETQEKMDHTLDELKQRSSDMKIAVDSYVKKNPMKSLGWALLTGTFLGFLLRR